MDFKVCLLLLFVFVFVVLRGSQAERVTVELPSSPPPEFTYTLDVDPIDRTYVCLNTKNNNNNTEWLDEGLSNFGNSLNVYSLYEDTKTTGSKGFKCFSDADEYLGLLTVTITEGGHINVTHNDTTTQYSTDQTIEVAEGTTLEITCSAHTGSLTISDTDQTFPSYTLATVTLQHNNSVVKCKREIGGDVLFVVSVTLSVLPSPATSPVDTTGTTSPATTTTMSTTTTTTTPITTTPIPITTATSTEATTIRVPTSTTVNTTTASSSSSSSSTPQTTNTTPDAITTTVATTPEATTTPPITTTPITTITTTTTSETTTPPPTTPSTTSTPESTTTTTTPTTTPTTTVTTESTTLPVATLEVTSPGVFTGTDAPTTQSTTTTTTTPIPASGLKTEQIVLLSAATITAVISVVVVIVCFLVCCCCVRQRVNTSHKLMTSDMYTEYRTGSIEKRHDSLEAPPAYTEEGDMVPQDIPQSEFKARVSQLWEQECNGLVQEYNSLGGNEVRYPAESAVLPDNTSKNRYRNILPYDRSRVRLEGGQGYINASHIPGTLIPQTFISSQGPKENSVNDFWLMVWQQKVRHIVMLTRVNERGKKKCEQYWPDKVGDGEHRGPLFVTLVNLVTENMWTVREMVVRNGVGEKQLIRQLQFTGWPDFEAPKFPHDLIQFLKRVQEYVADDTSVICVHCSAGVGRSGTFIALYNLVARVEAGGSITIFQVVNEMREHRTQMVQAWTQYRFIYLSVLELIHGDTSVQIDNFPDLLHTRIQTHSHIFTTQFHELDFQSDKCFTRLIKRAFDVDVINPDTMVLPYEDTRVVLSAPYWDGSDYINASYVEGYGGIPQFIATQLPISESVRDLMQLIFQTKSPIVVLLASYLEYEGMKYDEGRIRYWPDPMTQHEFSGYTLMNENSFIHPLHNELKLVSEAGGDEHHFTLVTLLDWTQGGEFGTTADCLQRLFQVTQLIDGCQEEDPSRPIIVQCRDGSGATGVLIAALNSIGQMRCEHCVDIFQVAKRMRASRQYMISSLEQYVSVHSIVSSYIKGMSEDPPTPTAPYLSSL